MGKLVAGGLPVGLIVALGEPSLIGEFAWAIGIFFGLFALVFVKGK